MFMDVLHREFANEVRAEAARQGLSQHDISADTGLSLSTIGRLLNARRSPTLEDLAKLAQTFNLTAYELVRRAEDAAQRKPVK